MDELIGRPVDILFHEADRARARRNKAICLEDFGRAMSWELRKIRKDGEALWVRETARAMLIKNRPVILVVSEDITEGKRAAEAIREVQTELAHANRVATMGSSPRRSRMKSTSPSQRRSPTPRRRCASSPPSRRIWTRFGKRSAALSGTANGRAPSSSESVISSRRGRRSTSAWTSMQQFAGDRAHPKRGCEKWRPGAEGTRRGPSSGSRRPGRAATGDSQLDRQRRRGHEGGGRGPRELLIGAGTTESREVLVFVRDSGPGLAPAMIENLFKAFHTTNPNGLGLGLSICRSIVEAHGGRLWASANAPRGAVFQFTLPAHPVSALPAAAQ